MVKRIKVQPTSRKPLRLLGVPAVARFVLTILIFSLPLISHTPASFGEEPAGNLSEVGLLEGHTDWVQCVTFSPDGSILASGSEDKTICLWDVAEQRQVGLLKGHTGRVHSVTFSADGKTLVSGGWDNTIRLWDVAEQKQVGLLKGHTNWVNFTAFSPDEKMLASGSFDETVRLWNVAEQKQVGLLKGHKGWVYFVAFSPDGKMLASAGEENVTRLWDVAEQKQVGLLAKAAISVAFSPDGRMLASGSWDGIIRLWDVQTQKRIGFLPGHTRRVLAVLSLDGKTLASWSPDDRTVRLWDVVEQEQVAMLRGHTWAPSFIAFSPDGKLLASVSFHDNIVRLWDVQIPGRDVEPMEKQSVTWGKVKKTALFQNFPNPFNPETWIPFNLSKPEHVVIRIYSSTGQLVKTLNLSQKPSGVHLSKGKAAYWNGRNGKGEVVASGVYFYLMEAGSFRATKKMVIIR